MPWTDDTSQGRMVGDYISTSWVSSQAFGAFSVARQPNGTVFDQKIFVPSGGVSASSFPNPTGQGEWFSDDGARNANVHSVVHRARKEE